MSSFKDNLIHHSSHLGRDAEVLEESLVGAPVLPPHRLLHLLVGVDQLGRLLELVEEVHPEVDRLVVRHPDVLLQLDLVDLETDSLEVRFD